ncbi:MAG: hypothetical protein FJ189_05900 [Gammaproteobacteria bacterium]|nr:hypothetical protein [Gammaproteobacteria bacterium]
MLFEPLAHLRPNDLLLLYRGYHASWLIAALARRQRHFCLRVDHTGFAAVNAFCRSALRETVAALPTAGMACGARLRIAGLPVYVVQRDRGREALPVRGR